MGIEKLLATWPCVTKMMLSASYFSINSIRYQ